VTDLDELTQTSFDPVPSNPQVVALNGQLRIRCQLPSGIPVPTLRWPRDSLQCWI